MMTTAHNVSFAAAIALVRERVLVRGTSLCHSRDRLWREPLLSQLHQRVRAAAGQQSGTLAERWETVLAGADAAAVRLAAEALAVHLLIAGDIGADTKRAHVAATLARLESAPAIPRAIDDAFAHGPTPTGVAFKRRRLSQIAFLLASTGAWRSLPGAQRAAALEDPWHFRDWLRSVPVEGAQAQREAMLHIAHPDAFEPITSLDAKRRIVAALGRTSERALDTDEALAAIRARLTPRHGDGFSFAAEPLRDAWLP